MKTNLFSRLAVSLLFFYTHALFSQCVTSFPYSEGFEAAPSWTAGGTNSDWAWGTPTHPNINAAGGGVRCWCVGGLSGTLYNGGEQSYLNSPCYDFSSLNYPWISFKIFWECERQWDGAGFQYSINNGVTWTNVGAFGDPVDCNTANWFNISSINYLNLANPKQGWSGRIGPNAGSCAGGSGSGGWVTAKHCLSNLAGQPNVKFRFIFGSGTTCNSYDGIAIDDIYISNGTPYTPNFSVTCNGAGNYNFTSITPTCPAVSSYTWNFGDPGSGPLNISNIANPTHSFSAPGIYTVSLTVAGSQCNPPGTITNTVQVSNISNAIVSQSINCFGGTASASVNVISGIGPFTYTWSPTGGNSPTATGLPAGNYTVLVKDAYNCVYPKTVTITQPTSLTATTSFSNVTCNGMNNGTATVTVGGGTPVYTYSWIPSGNTSSVATGLGVGTHTVIVTDSKSCTITRTVTITQPTAFTTSIGSSNATCGQSNGSATVTISGGSPGYTYSWTPAGGTSSVANNLPGGNYTVVVTDVRGCTVALSTTVSQPATMTTSVTFSNVSCNGLSNGSATVNVVGGAGPYNYTWTPTPGFGQGTGTVSGLGAQTYTVAIADALGCTTTTFVTITQPTPLAALAGNSNVNCIGGTNGTATVSVGGGTPGYTYSWTPSGLTTSVITGLGVGTYTALVTDSKGCTITAIANVTQLPPLTASIVSSNVSCNGGNNGSATVIAAAGTPAYSYTWLPSGTNNPVISGLPAGTYTARVSDSFGCNATAIVTITQPSPLAYTLSTSNVSCLGGNNGTASLIASGGTPVYSYMWVPGVSNSSVATNLSAGSYAVILSDANNCTVSAMATITQPATAVSAIASGTNILCFGNSTGSANVVASGGSLPHSYSWNPTGGFAAQSNNIPAGIYTVTVKDANNCTTTATVDITQPPLLQVQANSTKICKGQNTVISGTATGGVGPYSYAWNNVAGSNTLFINPSSSTIYSLSATDANGCKSLIDTSIVLVAGPITLSVSPTQTICSGKSATLSATAIGGAGSYEYQWFPGNIKSNTITVTLSKNTVFTVSVNDNCTQPTPVAITTVITENLGASKISADLTKGCEPLCITFTNSAFAVDSLIQSSSWVYSDGTGANTFSASHCFTTAGTYSVYNSFLSKLGCPGTATLGEITVYPKPNAEFVASDYSVTSSSPNVFFTNQSSNATHYFWDFAGQQSTMDENPSYSFTEPGKYLVAFVASNTYCSDTTLKVIECLPEFVFYAPNVFTPNGDNLNDRFLPKGFGWKTESYRLEVFDKWGELLFSSRHFDEGWDGFYKGDLVANGAYVWTAYVEDYNSRKHEYKGTVTLIK